MMRALTVSVRRVVLVLCCVAGGVAAQAQTSVCVSGDGAHIRKACLEQIAGAPVYGHGVLGNTPEWHALTVYWGPQGQAAVSGRGTTSTLSQSRHIFEDVAPRLVDLDGDGRAEVVVVQSGFDQGARLMVVQTRRKLTPVTTPYIGRRNRWLAPIGAADLDGDGYFEIAFVDRPHLAKTLRVWRYRNGTLTEAASLRGLTNHRIGEADIGGGIRTCAGVPEMILASGDWQRVMAVRFHAGQLIAKDIGKHKNRRNLNRALVCK